MKVKLFDAEHEKDLEKEINEFLRDEKIDIRYIQYSTSHFFGNGEQIYSFSEYSNFYHILKKPAVRAFFMLCHLKNLQSR